MLSQDLDSFSGGRPLRRTFRPEFLNRVDDIMVFNWLDREHLGKIFELQLGYVRALLADKKIDLEVSEAAKDLVLKEGYDEQFGARPLKRSLQRLTQAPLALAILNGDFGEGDVVLADADDTQATIRFEKRVTVPV